MYNKCDNIIYTCFRRNKNRVNCILYAHKDRVALTNRINQYARIYQANETSIIVFFIFFNGGMLVRFRVD